MDSELAVCVRSSNSTSTDCDLCFTLCGRLQRRTTEVLPAALNKTRLGCCGCNALLVASRRHVLWLHHLRLHRLRSDAHTRAGQHTLLCKQGT